MNGKDEADAGPGGRGTPAAPPATNQLQLLCQHHPLQLQVRKFEGWKVRTFEPCNLLTFQLVSAEHFCRHKASGLREQFQVFFQERSRHQTALPQ